MLQDIKDEILDTSLQPDANPRYTIKNNAGVVINDNVQIELKTPVIQEGTPFNKALIETIKLMEQEDIGEEVLGNLYGNINATQVDEYTYAGDCARSITNYDPQITYPFKITSNRPLNFSSTNVTGEVTIKTNESSDVDDFNRNMKWTSYDADYYNYLWTDKSNAAAVMFAWDFGSPKSTTFKYRVAMYRGTGTITEGLYFETSTDGSTWNTLDVDIYYNPSGGSVELTDVRYFRMRIFLGATSTLNASARIYYSYFSDFSDRRLKIRNKFKSNNDFSIQNCSNVFTPSEIPMLKYVTENTINDIQLNWILQAETLYKLHFDGEKLNNNSGMFAKIIKGTIAGGSSVTLDEIPKLLIRYIYASSGEVYGVYADIPTSATIENTNSTARTMNYFALY